MELEKVIQYRRHIHRHAELSFQEHATQDYICRILAENNIEHRRVAGTGVLAQIGDERSNTVVLRADMDALPIVETADVDFASVNRCVMHACGHDMHSAMLLDALVQLSLDPPKGRCVLGLFQPGEEMHPGGASIVLADSVFDGFSVRAFVGQHCSPEMEVGRIGICPGEFMASTDEILLTVKGQGGHAALPHLLRDPVIAAAAILMDLKQIAPPNGVKHVLAFGRFVADGATNVIPSEVTIEGTFRTFSPEWRDECKGLVRERATRMAAQYDVQVDVNILDGYPSVFNNPEIALAAEKIICEVFGQEAVVHLEQRMTAEDFGFYTRLFPSLFLRLGVGSSTRLHTGDFCPDESSLAIGSRMLTILAREL